MNGDVLTTPDVDPDPTRYVHSSRAREDLLEPSRPGEHVWIVNATYVVPVETLRGSGSNILDGENLAMITKGCYICEQPYSERLSYRRCPGEPRD